MSNIFLLIILVSLFISTATYKLPSLNTENNNSIKPKKLLDTSLENIDSALRSNDFQKVCIESIFSQQIIASNINELKKLEPYYDWIQMNNLIKNISKKHCLAKSPDQ